MTDLCLFIKADIEATQKFNPLIKKEFTVKFHNSELGESSE